MQAWWSGHEGRCEGQQCGDDSGGGVPREMVAMMFLVVLKHMGVSKHRYQQRGGHEARERWRGWWWCSSWTSSITSKRRAWSDPNEKLFRDFRHPRCI